MELDLVHIRDPYLKQFSTEIYAQGREEYLEHVQQCLEEMARKAQASFSGLPMFTIWLSQLPRLFSMMR